MQLLFKQEMKSKSIAFILFLLAVITGIVLYNTFGEREEEAFPHETIPAGNTDKATEERISPLPIDELTSELQVVPYVKKNGRLPGCYVTKKEARSRGWRASKRNLCEVLPGRAIGGDVFANRERKLPERKGRIYYEADLNYNCGRRNADRLVFSNDGLIFVSRDHYKTFEKQ